MSWVLRNKKKSVAIALAALLIIALCLMRLYIVAIIFVASLYVNKMVIHRINLPMKRINAKREVETIDTLVVGDVCSQKIIDRYCGTSNCLQITAPGRSLYSTVLIIAHLESILVEKGTIVMIGPSRDYGNRVTSFDLPFISRISLLEIGIKKKSFILNNLPFFLHPIMSLKFLSGNGGKKEETECPDESIKELCKRKGFDLICLE